MPDERPAGARVTRLRAMLADLEWPVVAGALAVTILVSFLIPQKLSFLDVYFLPIILAGYLLGQRKAVVAAVFCVLVVGAYAVTRPDLFHVPSTAPGVYLHVTVWSAFLVLAGAAVGKLQERLGEQMGRARRLNEELGQKQAELLQTNASLEQSKRAVEALKAKVEDTLYATMDSAVANLIIEGRLRNEKRDLSVLFSDIVGFTAYSEEHPPEVVVSELNRYLRDCEPVIMRYRGHIDKYMGDGIMCEFGAPVDFETSALSAVLAAMALQARVAQAGYPWQVRIGVASGPAITGLIGSKRQTYTAIGDVVNLAARLERACTPGAVLLDQATDEKTRRFVETRRKRDLGAMRASDAEREQALQALQDTLGSTPDDAGTHFRIGQLLLELNETDEALQAFERALALDPASTTFKVGYAEASLKHKEQQSLSVRGRRRRVEAYEVVRLRDPLELRDKIPPRFRAAYGHAADLIQVPAEVVLPVEAIDGSIGHARAVAVIAFALADQFGLTEREKLDVLHAGFLADLGKEVVPHHVLNRRGGLLPAESDPLRQHPVESTRLMRAMGYDAEGILKMVRHSHEHFGGAGYPDGLAGEAIPLGSRIIAVADAYDALTSWRPYREAWEGRAALEELRRGVERGLYDPKVMEALAGLMG
jgi:HD-GYP domain-containing protein (c-di-GMP phosphodiesterase class II)/class 3 adenylate cyclase